MRHLFEKSRWPRGQSTAEFAQVALVFFLLIAAVMMMGEAVLAYNNIAAATEEAVRYAVANGPNSPNPATQQAIEAIAVNVAPQLHLTETTFNSNGSINFQGNVTATWVTDSVHFDARGFESCYQLQLRAQDSMAILGHTALDRDLANDGLPVAVRSPNIH